ncbi:hypothetical protein BC829DRAFT_382110 [Chytridium lagenaria]|nr:hypothetical protein BC829DRAFT_382110 [Chytridium lagenaria]
MRQPTTRSKPTPNAPSKEAEENAPSLPPITPKTAEPSEETKEAVEDLAPNSSTVNGQKYSQRVRERTYDVNLITTHMPIYEPLLDEYLQDYFSSPNTRKHLLKLGLIDKNGRIIDPKAFKYNQIYLDKRQYEENVLKSQEERELDRDIEVAIRRQILEDTNPRSRKMKRMKKPGHETRTSTPYPEFLSQYPVTMWKTALLYSEKPRSTVKALLHSEKPRSSVKARDSVVVHDDLSDPEINMPSSASGSRRSLKGSRDQLVMDQTQQQSVTVNKPDAPSTEGDISSASLAPGKPRRPKSARPTRTSSFPVASDFSDFGSDCGYESDAGSCLNFVST